MINNVIELKLQCFLYMYLYELHHVWLLPDAISRFIAILLGMQEAPPSIPASGTFFREDLVMKIFQRPFILILFH